MHVPCLNVPENIKQPIYIGLSQTNTEYCMYIDLHMYVSMCVHVCCDTSSISLPYTQVSVISMVKTCRCWLSINSKYSSKQCLLLYTLDQGCYYNSLLWAYLLNDLYHCTVTIMQNLQYIILATATCCKRATVLFTQQCVYACYAC